MKKFDTPQTWYQVRFGDIIPKTIIGATDEWVTAEGGHRYHRNSGTPHQFYGTIHATLAEAIAQLVSEAEVELAKAKSVLADAMERVRIATDRLQKVHQYAAELSKNQPTE